MTIEGSRVITPGGETVTGRYSRHSFDYVVPDGDAKAGDFISADQIDDENIRVSVTPKSEQTSGPPEIWRRCEVVS